MGKKQQRRNSRKPTQARRVCTTRNTLKIQPIRKRLALMYECLWCHKARASTIRAVCYVFSLEFLLFFFARLLLPCGELLNVCAECSTLTLCVQICRFIAHCVYTMHICLLRIYTRYVYFIEPDVECQI